jgi:hypothetical protein
LWWEQAERLGLGLEGLLHPGRLEGRQLVVVVESGRLEVDHGRLMRQGQVERIQLGSLAVGRVDRHRHPQLAAERCLDSECLL